MPTTRLRSLDVFRGLTVAAMVLVNSPGGDDVYAPLRHSSWNGCTATDLIFPAFLFIMGVSAAFSDAARKARGAERGDVLRRAFLRAALLIGLGLLENAFVYRDVHGGIRYPGVLQRIALCYLGVEAFLLIERPKLEIAATAALLLGYWGLISWGGIPSPEENIAYHVDRLLLSGHLLNDPWGDPEGLLSTVPALATSLIGLITGRELVNNGAGAAGRLMRGAAVLVAIGALWSGAFPLNKHLWTSSYAVFTAGTAMIGLAACLILIEKRTDNRTGVFEALGRHALAVYLGAGFLYGIQESIPAGGGNMKTWLTERLFGFLNASSASLAYAVLFTSLIATATLFVSQRLDRRQ